MLTICREYAQGLAWWRAQSRGDRVLMTADFRERNKVADEIEAHVRRKRDAAAAAAASDARRPGRKRRRR